MKKHRKTKNIVYIALLAVFLVVVGIRTIQNISLIQKISQNAGIEDASIESNIIIVLSGGGGGSSSSSSQSTSYSTSIITTGCNCKTYYPNVCTCTGGYDCCNVLGQCGLCCAETCKIVPRTECDACTSTIIVPICTPSCTGKNCGDNGCGGSCGTCGTGYVCTPTGQCSQYPDCDGYVLDRYCSGTENQTSCPDCTTYVWMTPNANLIVGTPAQVAIYFDDGRYLANHNVSFSLSIDGNVWDSSNGCQYGGVILSSNGVGGTIRWPVNTTPVTFSVGNNFTVSNNNNFTTSFTCLIPQGLGLGQHTLSVTPTIYSMSVTLRAVQVQFTAGKQPDLISYINSFITSVKSFLGIK